MTIGKVSEKVLNAFPQELWGDADKACLASGSTEDLPEQVKAAGEAVVDQFTDNVLAHFPNGGVGHSIDGTELDDLLEILYLKELKPRLNLYEYSDIAEFVAAVAMGMKLNPILLVFSAAWTSMPSEIKAGRFPEPSENRAKEIRQSVYYCAILDMLGTAMLLEKRRVDFDEPSNGSSKMLMDVMVEHFDSLRKKLDWKPYFNVFERLKLLTVVKTMGRVHTLKGGGQEADEAWARRAMGNRGVSQMLNILEAMYQDVLQGCGDNATAGFELMLERSNRKPIEGLGNNVSVEWVENDKRTGVSLHYSPFPREWNNLYHSWNLAFCSMYPSNIFFYAKLVAPVVSGKYHPGRPGLFLSLRLFCLYVHVHFVAFWRARSQSASPAICDFRNKVVTDLWGKVNREAANQYQKRVQKVFSEKHGFAGLASYFLKRVAFKVFWGLLKIGIRFSALLSRLIKR